MPRYKSGLVDVIETDHYVSFNLHLDYSLASAELSIYPGGLDEFPETHHGIWFYVNRVIVPKDFPIRHAGVILMLSMTKWADANSINLLEENSPYSTSKMTLAQLNQFDSLFGFKLVNPPNLLFRRHTHNQGVL